VRIHFLGTGASEGIPAINCDCQHCQRARTQDGRLVRERNAIVFSMSNYNLLVDTPPDIRALIIRHHITQLDGIFATHAGYEHVGGIKEFEYWREGLDFLAEAGLFDIIQREHWTPRLDALMFHIPYFPGAALYFGEFSLLPFAARYQQPVFGISLKEGDTRVIYTSDTRSRLTNYARRVMLGCDLLIVNTPHFQPPDEEHITVVEAIELKQQVRAKRLILTAITHTNQPHDQLEAYVSRFDSVSVAYDGLVVEV